MKSWGGETMDRTLERSTMRKVYLRLLPFAILSYVLAYIDRINVSFAGLTMRGDLGMSAGTFGFAVGMFYWAYFLFEVPSNVILEKVGARIWIARIMITWGILAGLTTMVTGPTSFGIVRFLLGVAEAGFFPGIILYFTYWFPSYHHARIGSGFLVGLPVASDRRADLNGAARPRWSVRSAGLASHVHRRSDPDRGDRGDHVFRAHGSASGSKIPHRGGTQLARHHDRRRTPRHREGAHIHAVAGALQSEGAAAGVELCRHRHRQPGHADFHSANDQVAG